MAGAAPAPDPPRFGRRLPPAPAAAPEQIAPLDEITAHGADDSGIAAVLPPDGLHQKRMAIMQGIIFGYDTSGFHICHLKAVTKKCQFGKNGDCILRRICYNEKNGLA